jgi:hypothetical protein
VSADGGDESAPPLTLRASLRDWFAGQVLQGELASQSVDAYWTKDQDDELATMCYRVADAMLRVRGQEHAEDCVIGRALDGEKGGDDVRR